MLKEMVVQSVRMLKIARVGANGLRRLHSSSKVKICCMTNRKKLKDELLNDENTEN